ncbi:polyadenylate-binding protein 2-like [Trichogramma pretiosum]|uniref:polyadenylate-binding protein 2-like n=1 Tax=Trichogramma pretiosum TaxID=7493 RepID=UPI000C718BF3|nr:polyadenylate-binding protein 2-like [Trichogramma pretiosum]
MSFLSEHIELDIETSVYEELEKELHSETESEKEAVVEKPLQSETKSEKEAELRKLRELIEYSCSKQYIDRNLGFPTDHPDDRSICVSNVHYSATKQELEKHFEGCGACKRITIVCDQISRHPKGYAYIEFAERDCVKLAIAKNGSFFRGRILSVKPKRFHRPGRQIPPFKKNVWVASHKKIVRPPSAYKWTRLQK